MYFNLTRPKLTEQHAKVILKGEMNMLDEKLMAEVWDDIENQYKPILQTGFIDFDTIMGLTEGKGALVTIAARPAMGKTTFMLSIMENILQKNKKCLYFSLEMSAAQIKNRILLMSAEIGLTPAKLGKLTASNFEKIAKTLEIMSKWNLSVDDTSCITVEEIEEKIKEEKPEIVFIDYFQLLGGKPKQDRLTQIEENMKDLKRISKENEVIIFMASQLSRAVESRCDKHPMLSDLRESGAIENISDVVVFLYRDEYYNFGEYDDELRPKGETEVIVAKNKFGCCGVVHLTFKANIPKFYDKIVESEF